MNFLFDVAFRSTLALGAAWLAVGLLRRASADLRHYVWLTGLAMTALSLVPASAPAPMRIALDVVPSVNAAAASLPAPWNTQAVLYSVWVAGSSLVLTRLALDLHRLADVTRKARSHGPDGIRWSDAVATPMTWGARRPVILLPAYLEQWSPEKRATAILHERAHIARRDWTWQIFARVLTALFWFHPLVWMAAARLRAEAERATDDLVLMGGVPAAEYAQQLLDVARQLRGAPPRISIAMVRTPLISSRIAAILDPLRSRKRAGRGTKATIALGFVLFFVTAVVCQAERIYKVAEVTTPPRVASKIEPKYTPQARAARIEGIVVLTMVIKPNGRADQVRVARSLDKGLDASAVSAIRKWHFDPGKKDGKAVPVAATIEVNFHLL